MNSNKISISVVMATYNGAKYLREQLDSILNQSVAVDEIVIVDDGSTDNTLEIIKEFQDIHPFIHLIKNKQNIGVVKTFEVALNNCTGEYILFSDQDDVWLPEKVERLIQNIGDNLLIYSDAVVVDNNLRISHDSNLEHFEETKKFEKFTDYLFSNNVTGCTMMINRKLLEILPMPFPDLKVMYHDQYMALFAAASGKLLRCPYKLIYYRQHESNVTSVYNQISYSDMITQYEKLSADFTTLHNIILCSNCYLILQEIIFAIDYYLALAHKKYPSIALLKFCRKNMSSKDWYGFIRMSCFGKSFAYIVYTIGQSKSISKIKAYLLD